MSFLYDFPSSVENKKGILKNSGNQLVNSFGYTGQCMYIAQNVFCYVPQKKEGNRDLEWLEEE